MLLVRARRQQHHHLGRRRPDRQRNPPSPNRQQLLEATDRNRARPLPPIILHLAPDPLPPHRQHHLLRPGPPALLPLRPDRQRALPRRNLHPHLRPPPQQILHPRPLPHVQHRSRLHRDRRALVRRRGRALGSPRRALKARARRPLRQRRPHLVVHHLSQRRDPQPAAHAGPQGVLARHWRRDPRARQGAVFAKGGHAQHVCAGVHVDGFLHQRTADYERGDQLAGVCLLQRCWSWEWDWCGERDGLAYCVLNGQGELGG